MDTNKLPSLRPLYIGIIENVAPKRHNSVKGSYILLLLKVYTIATKFYLDFGSEFEINFLANIWNQLQRLGQ